MPHTTSRLGLRYPDLDDGPADIEVAMGNLASDIDNAAIYNQGLYSAIGLATTQGKFYFATDIGANGTLYLANGSVWKSQGGVDQATVDETSIVFALVL